MSIYLVKKWSLSRQTSHLFPVVSIQCLAGCGPEKCMKYNTEVIYSRMTNIVLVGETSALLILYEKRMCLN